jgi:two-component system response regulator AtoC
VRGGAMGQIYQLVDRIAAGSISVLLLGETGVGKEVVARAIHQRSARSEKPFVVFDCAAVAPNLIESELFGHVKGAFTGANENRDGAFVQADGGTLFLDEIGELALELQPKLLRALEQHSVRPVGGGKEVPVDVRIIAATHRSLEREITKARFREDLFYRLNGISLLVPPLRERRDEIMALATAFLANASQKAGAALMPQLSSEAEELLSAYGWPGNVRELRNAMERALLLCDGPLILPEHLPLDNMKATVARTSTIARGSESNLAAQIDALEQERILTVLADCGGNQSRAARQLGISRKTLLARLDAYGVPRPHKRS